MPPFIYGAERFVASPTVLRPGPYDKEESKPRARVKECEHAMAVGLRRRELLVFIERRERYLELRCRSYAQRFAGIAALQ